MARLRSMGASLLDAVLAETLDPAYAQAAARARAAEREPAPQPRRWGRRRWSRSTMVVAGLLVAVTYDQAAATSQGREQVRAALIDDIQRESAVSDELPGQLEELRAEVSAHPGRPAGGASAVGQRALDELAARRGGRRRRAGHRARVCSSPSPTPSPTADDDPVGGDHRRRTRAARCATATCSWWSTRCGRPAPRRSASTASGSAPPRAIRFAGEAVLVDFRPVTNPYEISAIGDPETAAAEFLGSPEVGALAVISETFGLRFDFAQEDELSLPAASTPELRSAVPEGPAEPDAPATDPTPGG